MPCKSRIESRCAVSMMQWSEYPAADYRKCRRSLIRTPPRGPGNSLLLFSRRGRSRSFAHDQEHGVLVLGAIPMHLLAEMGHEAAGGHRRGVGGIEFRSRADPPGTLQHGDVAVVGMEVRPAEMIALQPFRHHRIEP